MRKLLLIFLLAILSTQRLIAQVELIIPWQDGLSLRGVSHVVDDSGNTYILSTLNGYDPGPGLRVEGDATFGSVVIKIDENSNLLWKQLYPIGYVTQGTVPATQLFISNDNIFIPYNIYEGLQVCKKDSTGTTAQFSARNGALFINKRTGDTLRINVFNEGPSCGWYSLRYAAVHKNKNVSYIYVDENDPDTFFVNERDASLDFISANSYYYHYYNGPINVVYDTINEQYLSNDNKTINIYDLQWHLVSSFALPYPDSIPAYPNVKFSYNDQYYAINYYDYAYGSIYSPYTAIFSKKGSLVSCQKSPAYSDMLLTNQNELFCISSLDFSLSDRSLVSQPLSFYQMDLFQNIQRQKTFGAPYVIVNKISVTTNNEIIVTGTFNTSNPYKYPDQIPDGVYYYKESLDNIPLLITNNSICSALSVYPNPTKNSINITSDDFNTTYNSTVEIFNVLGQKITGAVYDTKTLSLDLTAYPAGIYFLKIRNSNSSCVKKIEKQ